MISTAKKRSEVGLSGKKKRIAQLLADPDCRCSVTELLKNEGLTVDTFCRYLDDEDFVGYVRELTDKYSEGSLAAVWGALTEKCKSGDMRAIKLYFELKGKTAGVGQDDSGVMITGGDELE